MFLLQDLIDQTMMNVDSQGICPFQISDKFFERRPILERINLQNTQQRFGLLGDDRLD
jgi:hypothetical protein